MRQKTLRSYHWMPLTGALMMAPLLGGCPAAEKESAKPAKAEAKPAKAPAKPEEPAAAEKAAGPSADEACMAKWSVDGTPKKIEVGARAFAQTGTKVDETTSDEDKKAVLGVLANLKEDTPENLKNIAAALAFFKEKGADAIVVVGDLGETQSQIENGMKPIAESGLPVFSVIGNRERKTDYKAAIAAVQATHPNVMDLNQVRLAAMDDVALVSVPGYYDKAYIHAEDGCQYFPGDLERTKSIIKAAEGKPVVLVSHGPPRQEGSEALDRTLEQANVGDPNLAKLIEETGLKFGVFSNIQEAGGRATDASGKTLLKPNAASEALFLNPGAVDSVSWKMNDGSRSVGLASVMTIEDGKASYELFRVKEAE